MTNIATAIAAIQSQLAQETRPSFVEIRENGHEVVLGGNRAGLLEIALHALTLAGQGVAGSHVHMDEHSGADVAERALVIRRSADEA